MMHFQMFTIIGQDSNAAGAQGQKLLINVNHIVSIRPIKIVVNSEVLRGHWIRLSNGKKYRAIKIPFILSEKFDSYKMKELPVVGNAQENEIFLQ
jgi:hypothetical protein